MRPEAPESTVSSLVEKIVGATDRAATILDLRDTEIQLRTKANKSRATAKAGLQMSAGGGAVIILQNLPVFFSGIVSSFVPVLGVALGAVVLGGLILSWNKNRAAEDLVLNAERIRIALAEAPPERET